MSRWANRALVASAWLLGIQAAACGGSGDGSGNTTTSGDDAGGDGSTMPTTTDGAVSDATSIPTGGDASDGAEALTGFAVVQTAPSTPSPIYAPPPDMVTVAYAVNDGPADTVDLYKNGSLLANLTAPYSYTLNVAADADGTYDYVAKARKGTQTAESAAYRIIVDRTAPTVVTRTPVPGAKIAASGPLPAIAVTFSKPMKASTFTDTSVVLSDSASGTITSTKSLSTDGTTLTITPAIMPTAGKSWSVALDTTITDLAGHPLTVPTDAWAWSYQSVVNLGGPIVGRSASGTVGAPKLVNDSHGKLYLLYEESTASTSVDAIHVKTWNGASWVEVGTPPSDAGALRSDLVVSPTDQLYLAHGAATSTGQYGLTVDTYDATTGWTNVGGTLLPPTTAGVGVSTPTLAVGSSGKLIMGYFENDAGDAIWLLHAAQWNAGAWTLLGGALLDKPSPTTVVTSAYPVDWGFVGLDASENIYAMFLQQEPSIISAYTRAVSSRRWDPMAKVWRTPAADALDMFVYAAGAVGKGPLGQPLIGEIGTTMGDSEYRIFDATNQKLAVIGSIGASPTNGQALAFVYDPAGRTDIAYSYSSGMPGAFPVVGVDRWDPSKMVSTTLTPGGLGDTSVTNLSPSIALDESNYPCVAYWVNYSSIQVVRIPL
jgi:hypothetical protein